MNVELSLLHAMVALAISATLIGMPFGVRWLVGRLRRLRLRRWVRAQRRSYSSTDPRHNTAGQAVSGQRAGRSAGWTSRSVGRWTDTNPCARKEHVDA